LCNPCGTVIAGETTSARCENIGRLFLGFGVLFACKRAYLVVRSQHLFLCAEISNANVGIKEPLAKYLILVKFSNLTFENEPNYNRDSNVKFIPLVLVAKSPETGKTVGSKFTNAIRAG